MVSILRVLLCGTIAIIPILPVRAQGGGTTTYSFSSAGGFVTGTVTVNPDGTATVTGKVANTPFVGTGSVSIGPDGGAHFSGDLYSSGDLMYRQPSSYGRHIEIDLEGEDFADGNPVDDNVGEVDVSAIGVGIGTVQIYA